MTAKRDDGSYDQQQIEALKAIVTQLEGQVERKFKDSDEGVLPCRLCLLTNAFSPLPIGPDDRR